MGNKQMLKQKGITLVSLVITIVILLILAGISIAQLTGNGLFKNAKLAKEKYENEQDKENSILGDYENKINNYVNSSRNSENANDYATDEIQIGTWINGKPIYQKVFTGLSKNIPVGSWCYGAINIPDIETPIFGSALYGNNLIMGFEIQPNDNGNIDIRGFNSVARTINTLIIQYTKKDNK